MSKSGYFLFTIIMDNELRNFRLNINQIAALTDLHRQTVATRLTGVPLADGSNEKRKLYSVQDILISLISRMPEPAEHDLEEMDAHERKAWFQSERERLKFEQETAQLIPAPDVYREFAAIIKACTQVLETLPDILERDCALPPVAVTRVQEVIDDLRVRLAEKIFNADAENQNGGDAP